MTIYRIASGESYKNETLQYPLRQNNHDANQKNDLLDYFNSEQDLLNLKDDLLYRWDLSIEQDILNKYKIPLKILREINHGDKFKQYGNYKYPIRNKNIRNIYNFTQEEIINLLKDLRETSISMVDLGKKYKNINRSTIRKINNGQSYLIKNYDYPARKTR